MKSYFFVTSSANLEYAQVFNGIITKLKVPEKEKKYASKLIPCQVKPQKCLADISMKLIWLSAGYDNEPIIHS